MLRNELHKEEVLVSAYWYNRCYIHTDTPSDKDFRKISIMERTGTNVDMTIPIRVVGGAYV